MGFVLDLLRLVYPPRCLACNSEVAQDGMLCGPCRRDTPFISGLACDMCGVPLPGSDDVAVHCDDCQKICRPWERGRAVFGYSGQARRMILAYKHADRPELGWSFAPWLARSLADILTPDTILVPVPIHPLRLIKRKYNQSAILTNVMARQFGLRALPDALRRTRPTPPLEGLNRVQRFDLLDGAIAHNPTAATALNGADVVLIDDVMTTGATLAACADVLAGIGAKRVCVGVLARVALDT